MKLYHRCGNILKWSNGPKCFDYKFYLKRQGLQSYTTGVELFKTVLFQNVRRLVLAKVCVHVSTKWKP